MMTTRQLVRLIAIGLILSTGGFAADPDTGIPQDGERKVLNLLTWSDYLDPDLVTRFEEKFNAKVVFTYFETEAQRAEILARQGPRGFDLTIVTDADLPPMKEEKWISPIDPKRIPNREHLDPRCRSGIADIDSYSVPYFWGTLGIAYRSDLVEQPINRWIQLYEPAEQLRGKIVMIDDPREILGIALVALGKSLNSESPREWEEAGQLALAQKPYVGSYGYVAVDERSGLVSGEVLAAQLYNGDALAVQEHNKNIRYVHPEEGSCYWVDRWVLFAQAPEPELAHAFLNFINEPGNAAENAQSVYFATCNKGAEAFLPAEFLADPGIYPPPDVMRRLEPYKILSPRTTRKLNSLYSQIVKGP